MLSCDLKFLLSWFVLIIFIFAIDYLLPWVEVLLRGAVFSNEIKLGVVSDCLIMHLDT